LGTTAALPYPVVVVDFGFLWWFLVCPVSGVPRTPDRGWCHGSQGPVTLCHPLPTATDTGLSNRNRPCDSVAQKSSVRVQRAFA
jgi:hypothetical protein